MKKFVNKVTAQIFIILIPLLVSIFYPIQNIAPGILSLGWDVSNFNETINNIVDINIVISMIWGLLGSVFICLLIRRSNKNKLFNRGSQYNDYPLWLYWTAGRILGYGKITLVRVPIYLQFQLLFKDYFPEVLIDGAEERKLEVKIIKRNMNEVSNEINLILIDTYKIVTSEIPQDKVNLPTIIIESGNQIDSNRSFNPEFLKEVRKITNIYRKEYKQINVFATTNTDHNKAIINKCFKNGGRTGFENIFVYQASRGSYVFEERYKVL
ncbi:hypothetical protein [Oceanobacillus oncorhynchi]|uniref:hypothetical protein n=1 Tax=Oceanobacillus oncorhynchi TaxID=545501 RepID=UPI0034D68030